ncbi:hypothetical protein ABPG74_014216 [Tetrahymena malaccensis]
MSQYEEDSALPFAEIEENPINSNNIYGSRKKNSQNKDELKNSSSLKQNLDNQQINQLKKQNVSNSNTQKAQGVHDHIRQKRNSSEIGGTTLPRINGGIHLSQEKLQKKDQQNIGINESNSVMVQNKKNFNLNANSQLAIKSYNMAQRGGNGINSLSFSNINQLSQNLQVNSAKFQKKLYQQITSATQLQQGLTFTQRVDNLAFPISNYQMAINSNDYSVNRMSQKNFRQTTQNFNDQIRRSTMTNSSDVNETLGIVQLMENQNNVPIVKSHLKEQTHEIHKLITPNAYKVLKMKQTNGSYGGKEGDNKYQQSSIINKCFSPVKQRYSNQNIDEKTIENEFKEEVQDNRDFKTLSDIMENQPNQSNKETIQEQIEKLKSQIPKLMSTQKNKKNVHSVTSLQELYEHQLMSHTQNIDKLTSQLQLQLPHINVQTIDSEGFNSSKGKLSLLDKYQVGSSQLNNQINISQFNQNVENTLNESALINQEKVSIIKEMNQKSSNKTNFYGQFISRCLEQSQLDMLNTPLKNLKKKELFETDLEKIKVSSQLLDIIDKQIFQENDQSDQIESQFTQNDQDSQSNQSQRNMKKKGVLTQKQKDKLFQVLADTDKIVVHTSQNKDLMVPSERKDVVRLAQWLEEMLEKIYNIKDQDFYEYFENIQLVCSACMSEIIRQISVSLQERGNLVKRVWESFLNLMKQAFEQLTQEKIENEKNLKEEIKQIHKMYLKKLDEYMPEIEKQKKKLEQQETQNKRVVLEFRYLRKKDTKLEKYLKLAKKDLRQLEEDYARLDQDYQKFKQSYEKQEQYYQQALKNQKQKQKNSGISFNKQDEMSEVEYMLNEHIKNYNDITNKAKLGFENFNENYENYNKDIKQLHDKYVQDIKKFQKGNKVQIEDLDQFEENIYSKKGEVDRIMQLDERIIEEIEGSDGITLIIGHCGVQTGPDLLKMTHQSVDTSSLTTFKERTTQTFVAQIDVKEIQTPAEWMAVNIGSTSPSNNNGYSYKTQKGQKPSKFSSASKINSQNEVEDDDEEIQRKRIEIEQQEQKKLEKIKQLVFKTEDEETQERQKLQQLPFVKQFLIDSPMLQKSGLLLNWKDKSTSQQNDEDNNQSDVYSSSNDEQEDQIDENPNQNNADGNVSGGSSPRKSKKIHESLSQTIQNKVEKDLEDLHTLVMSRTSYVTSLCEKIIKHQLLKENEIVTIQMIEQFIDDSKQIILEEHNRLKRIWERSKKGILEQVKSKIIIAEKDAELQEVQNDKEIIEQQIKFFRKEINLLDDKKSDSSTIIETINKKKNSQSFNSLEDITDEDEFEDSNNNLSSLDEDEISEKSQSESTTSLKNDGILKTEGSISKQESKKNKLDSVLTQNNKQRNSIMKKSVNNSSDKSQNALVPPSPLPLQSSPTKPSAPILQIQQNSLQQKRIKKKQTLNPLNRVSISLIEAVQGSKTQQKGEDSSPLIIEKRFTPISQKKESIFGSLTNQQSMMSSSSVLSSNQSSQSSWLKTIQINNKLSSTNISPNSDSAAIFFNKFALKIMVKEISKADKKTVIMKQQNVLRHLQSIYQDKIKSVKNSEEDTNGGSRTLNVVTYDYFLNQFGFKKLAETKLKQFLDSCIYYNINFKIRQFTKLYGINKIMNYDFEDFDFFTKMMLFLEEGSSQQQIQANIYPINRVVEALFRNFENKIPASEMIRLKQELENMKIPDSTAKQKNKFAIDSDHALDILLQALIEEKKLCIQNLQSVYLAGDINCDQVIAYDEYLTLFRHFESGLFNILSVTKFYYQNCDLLDRFTNQRIMSFQKFALTSVQGDLFSKQIQDDYSNKIDNYDRIKNIDSLERHWEDKKDVIRLRFVKNGQYKLFYRQMIKRIDDHFALKKEQRNQLEKNTTWFVYRLLDDESKRIMTDSLIDQLIPEEFNILTNFEIDLIKKFCLNA